MDDKQKTKANLLEELADLRRLVEKLEKTAKSVRIGEEKYRSILDNIEDGYYEVDLSGKYTFVNPSVCKYHGRTSEEMIGQRYRKFLSNPESAENIFFIFNEIFRTGIPAKVFDYQIIHKQGDIRDLEMSASLIRDADGKPIGFRGISRDITDRKRWMIEQERYRDFFENATDGCFEVDLTGKITFVNEAACRIFQFTRDEFSGMNYRDYTTPETAQRLLAIYNEIYRTGQPSKQFDYEIIHKGQEIRYVETAASLIRDSKGDPIGFRGITRDVTDRKMMEAEQERYRDFVENIEDGCYELDLEGNYTFVNEAASRRFGYSRDEFMGLNHKTLTSPETAKKMFAVFNEIYRTGQPSPLIEDETLRKDGTVVSVQTKASLIRDGKGKPIGFRGVSRDITERKKLEAEQERYRNFVENISDWCFEVDLRGKFTFVNEALARRSGYPRESLVDVENLAFSDPEEGKKIREVFNEVYRTGLPSKLFEYKHTRRNGEVGYVQMAVSLIRDNTGKPIGFRGVSRDITELKSLETEQQRSWDFVENITDGCFEVDLAGNMTFFNAAACGMFGYPREELMGMNNRAYTSPETAKNTFKIFNEIYRTGSPAKIFDYAVIHKDGTISTLEMSASLIRDQAGNPVGFRGISRDISERKKAEEERERYRNFFENINDGCYEQDLAGNYTFVNEASCRIFGYTQEEFLKVNFRDITTPETAARLRTIFSQLYQAGTPTGLIDMEIFRKDKQVRHIQTMASLIRDAHGNPIGFRGVSRDITERKKMEAETLRLTEQLNQARKLEAIGTLAGGVAHDFNNLLMGIQGYASLMLLDVDTHHPFYEKLKAIEAQVKSAADLTGQLLGYARGGRYEVKTTNMNELIGKTASLFGRTKKGIRIHQTLAKDLWKIEADRGQLEQVLLNLFMNAWQAMPGGGTLYLQTENVVLDESYVEPYGTAAGPYIKISVTDTGVGMDRETKARIFEPFFTTKEMGRGTGLGLATAYGIISGHHGIINVYSEKGYGTTFNFYLPSSSKEMIPLTQPAREIHQEKETLLLVDDEKMITEVTGTMINRLGYQILIAHSGEEAVEIYLANTDRIDLVIMDLVMPGIGGGEAFDLIKSINPKVKIILSSGFSLNGEAKEIMSRGACAFIQKPFLMDELSKVIREVLESP